MMKNMPNYFDTQVYAVQKSSVSSQLLTNLKGITLY